MAMMFRDPNDTSIIREVTVEKNRYGVYDIKVNGKWWSSAATKSQAERARTMATVAVHTEHDIPA